MSEERILFNRIYIHVIYSKNIEIKSAETSLLSSAFVNCTVRDKVKGMIFIVLFHQLRPLCPVLSCLI